MQLQKKVKYNNIKKVLRFHIDKGIQSLWNFDEENKEFICVFKRFNNDLKIYTPQQLIDYLNEIPVQEVQEDKELT